MIINVSKIVHIDDKTSIVTIGEVFLRLDDRIEIFTQQVGDLVPIVISINFLDRPWIFSKPEVNASLSWICNGPQNYTINIKNVDSRSHKVIDIKTYYQVTRGKYYLIWLFPIGLIIAGILIIRGLRFTQINPEKRNKLFISQSFIKEIFDLQKIYHLLIKKAKSIDYFILLLLTFFLMISSSINVSMIHNDEVGGGRIDNWGYYAWGYVDTAEQVAKLLKQHDFNYDSWHVIHNNNKPLLGIYFMALFIISFPTLNPVIASRLFIQISSALACIMTYLLIKKIFDKETGIMSSLLLLINPIFLHYSRIAYLDVPCILFMSSFFFSLYKASFENQNYKYVYISGITLGLVISTKSPLFLYYLLPIAFIWIWINREENSSQKYKQLFNIFLKIFIIGFIAVILFLLLWPYFWVNTLMKFSYIGMFFGLLGHYGPVVLLFSYPTLFLGRIMKPHPLIKSIIDIIYQTTYFELFGFILGIASFFSIITSKYKLVFRANIKHTSILYIFLFSLIGSGILYEHQHRLLYLIWPYTIISAIGYIWLAKKIEKYIFSYSSKITELNFLPKTIIFNKKIRPLFLIILLFSISCQIALVKSVSPYFGLYYNKLFLLGTQPQEIFNLPEPVYGLDQIATYIKENPVLSKNILTNISPHVLQYYLPDYKIMKDHVYPFINDMQNMLIIRSLDFEYVIIGEWVLQHYPEFTLKATLDKYAELVFVSKFGNMSFAYLYHIPNITLNQVIWKNDIENARNWLSINNNIDVSYFSVLPSGQISVELNFSSAYPPSIWFKLYQQLSYPINLNNASIYSVYFNLMNVESTITISLINQYEVSMETIIKYSNMNYEKNIFYMNLSDMKWIYEEPHDFSNIVRIELNFYNSAQKSSGTILIDKIVFVRNDIL